MLIPTSFISSIHTLHLWNLTMGYTIFCFSLVVMVTVSASSLWVMSMLSYIQILRISPGSPQKVNAYEPGADTYRRLCRHFSALP